jgi:sugar phosphate permease
MSFLATFAATGVSLVVFGGIQVFITDDTGWKKSTISFAVTAGTWASGLLAPLIGRLADRYGPRWLMPGGIIVAAASFFWLAGAQGLWQFFAAYILGRAISNPVLIGVVPSTVAVNFFRRRRNIALALTSTFRPIGSAINIQIISIIAVHYGWRAAYRYLGVLSLLLVVPVVLVMRRQPEDIGLLPDGARRAGPGPERLAARAGESSRQEMGHGDPELSWTLRAALRTRTFWLITITAAFGTLASGTVIFSLVPYLAEDAGLSKGQAAGVLSLGTFLAITTLGWGYLADVVTPRRCLVVALAVSGIMVLYLTTVSSLAAALAFALVFGTFSGAADSLQSMMLAQYYGRGSYGSILGVFVTFQIMALGLGPALGSVVREVTGSYNVLYLILAAAYIMAGLLIFLVRAPRLVGVSSSPSRLTH